ncbi:ABC transporter substrate-binding protein [Diplocloster modestus]|uniref:Extracellular solute-binding protein n=1 Tax=Diplocloster modestus TaxID=2850322 RepID=A0ABS6KB73_9FIRM|nr:extracellular solute-binding protein [Diplocloster modestus]MBU9727765.1 extracellular solute-binding protein [Diplocloster modestus]
MKKRISLYIFLTSFLFIILFLYLWFNNENENKNPGTVKTILRVAMWKDSSTDKNLDIIESFMSMYPDVQVEVVTFLPDTYSSSLDTLLNGQQPVDVFFIHELTQLTNLSEKGVLKPLDFLFSHSDMDPGQYLCLDSLKNPDDGTLYALPYKISKNVLYYNRSLFSSSGIRCPDKIITWSDFQELGQRLTERLTTIDPEMRGILLLPHARQLISMTLNEPLNHTANIPDSLNQGLELMLDIQSQGSMVPFSYAYEKNFSEQVFENGKYAMFLSDNDFIRTLAKDASEGKYSFEWGVAPQPQWSSEETLDKYIQVVPICIYRYTDQSDAAWKFLSFLCGKPGATLLAEDLLIPAYTDSGIQTTLIESAKEYRIDESLFHSLDKQWIAAYTYREADMIPIIYDTYMNMLMGLLTPEEGLEYIRQQQSFISE